LPRTRGGNRYILAVICNVSKWPTIILLKDLKAEIVAEKLLELFSFSGLPRVIRSDNFQRFRGDLMTALRTKLGIERKFSAPFHPISHGSVDRLNGTVESVLRKMLIEQPNDWDISIKFINFALRAVKHDSAGYAPSELVFGHKFRGLLHLAREEMENISPNIECKRTSTTRYLRTDRAD